MEPDRRRKRFLDILKNRKTDDKSSLLDMMYPPSALLTLIPSTYHESLNISSKDLPPRYGVEDVFKIMGALCLYQIGNSLSEKEESQASGFFLVYSQYFYMGKAIPRVRGIPALLQELAKDGGKSIRRIIDEKLFPFLMLFFAENKSSEEIPAIRNGSWATFSQSYSYNNAEAAVDRLIEALTGVFPALKNYLDREAVPLRMEKPAYDIRDHFLSDDEIMLLADDAISKVPRGEAENRAWYRILSPKIFCHLSNKRLARRASKTIFQKLMVHHIELDLLARQRRYLLARLQGVVPDPVLFLDRTFGSLCFEKLKVISSKASDITVSESDFKDIHPDYHEIFDRLSRGVFFLDIDSNTIYIDRRSAVFHAAYSLVEGLDADPGLLPKLSLDLFDVYSFIGRIAMDTGRKGRIIRFTKKLIERSRKRHGIRDPLMAGFLLAYADLHPQDRECSELLKMTVHNLANLWNDRVPSRILDQAAELLNILGLKKLENLLEEDLKQKSIDSDPWTSSLRRFAFIDHPMALDTIKRVVDAMPKDYPEPPQLWPNPDPDPQMRWSRVHTAVTEFPSPYREVLLEYMALQSPMAMRQCIHDIARSDSPPALRRFYDIGSFRPPSIPSLTRRYAKRMLREYATPARTPVILEQLEGIKDGFQSRYWLKFNRANSVLGEIRKRNPQSPLETYRGTPLALGRKLVSFIGTENFHNHHVRFLLLNLRSRLFWPVLDELLPLHTRFLADDSPGDLALFYREVLLRMSNRNNTHILEREIRFAEKPDFQALLLECMGNAHALRVDSLFEHHYSSPSLEVAIAAVRGLKESIGKEAEERLKKISLDDNRMAVREAALESLAGIQSPHALPYLKKRIKSKSDDPTAIDLLAGYALPETEELMVDAIRRVTPSDRWMYNVFLLKSGGKVAIREFIQFVGNSPGYYLEDRLGFINPASLIIAIDEWLVAIQKEAEGWKIPVLSILARSPDPRCIPVLLEHAYKSDNPIVRSAAIKHLIRDVDFTRCPPSLELILSYSKRLEKQLPGDYPGASSGSTIEEIIHNRNRDDDILWAYIESFRKKGYVIPAQWREYIPAYILDGSHRPLRW